VHPFSQILGVEFEGAHSDSRRTFDMTLRAADGKGSKLAELSQVAATDLAAFEEYMVRLELMPNWCARSESRAY
jgi:hypothetical protein